MGSISPDDPRLKRCGFAKLVGPGIEFYVRKYEVYGVMLLSPVILLSFSYHSPQVVMGRWSKSSALDIVVGGG